MASARVEGLPGRLITLEGVEGAGKSTQLERLRDRLAARGVSVVATREPDGTRLGAGVRALLRDAAPVPALAETLLFAASRTAHVRDVVRPALERGAVVLCDRFVDSTVAYQGHGRGVPLPVIAELNRLATEGLVPALTIVLDLDVAEGLRRVRGRAGGAAAPDPFEALELEFHERVRKGYWAIRDREPERVVLVDGARPAAVVAEAIWDAVAGRLGLGAG